MLWSLVLIPSVWRLRSRAYSMLDLMGGGNFHVISTVALSLRKERAYCITLACTITLYERQRTMEGPSTTSYLFLISQFNDTYRYNDAQKEARIR